MPVKMADKTTVFADDLDSGNEDVDEEFYPVEYRITSYGADYDVDGLVKRLKAGDIEVPNFQRSYVWRILEASRFIESLLLGLPVPAIFLARDENEKLLVIDGQQRLRTLQYFYNGIWAPTGERFDLRRVHSHYQGKTYATLDDRDRRKLDNSIMHAIIIRQDGPQEDAPSSVFHIFERLNTGGVRLKPQEIRSAVYHGELSSLLSRLNENANWRLLIGPVSKDRRDQELILRFLALLNDGEHYKRPMKEFLNSFMFQNRHLDQSLSEDRLSEDELSETFESTVEVIAEVIGDDAFKPRKGLNAALCDAVMVGVAKRLKRGEIKKPETLRTRFEGLLADEKFQAAIATYTTDEKNVETRLSQAEKAFGRVK